MLRHDDGNRARVQRRGPAKCSCPHINTQIIAAAETKNLALLMATVEEYLKHMNIVNLSTTLHRLAKLAVADPAAMVAFHEHQCMTNLVKAVRDVLWHAGRESAAPQCQALSNIVWSLATLQVVDEPVLDCAAELACRHLAGFKQFELASLLWSYAKIVEIRPDLREQSLLLFRQAAEYLKQRLDQFTFRCLVMLSWAYSAVQEHHAELFASLAMQMTPLPRAVGCNDLVTVAVSLSGSEVWTETLFADIANKAACRIHDFSVGELVDLFGALATAGYFHHKFVEKALAVVSKSDMSPSQLSGMICAALSFSPRQRTVCSATLALLQRCGGHWRHLDHHEMSSVSLAVVGSFRSSLTLNADGESFAIVNAAEIPSEVVDFVQAVSSSGSLALSQHGQGASASLTISFQPVAVSEAVNQVDSPHSVGHTSLDSSHTSESCAVVMSGSSTTASGSAGDEAAWQASDSTPDVVVKNTFVHVEGSCYSEKRAFLEGLLGKPISPPLDILPHEVSTDELLAFRIDYQMFRAGQAFGARGEVSNTVVAEAQ